MDVEVLLFDGFDELDGIGPYEVLATAGERGADVAVRTSTLGSVQTVTASHGLTIVPDGTLGSPDLLVVPGGGWSSGGGVRREVDSGTLPAAIDTCYRNGSTVASVCTGAMLLVAAGVLEGRPATTHHVAYADLERATERVDARVVDDGDVLTAGGITAGLDLGFHLIEREFGRAVADDVAQQLEYERRGEVYGSA